MAGVGENVPLIPVRMLNEHVYCLRLAYLMWVHGEFAHTEFTVDGTTRHRRVDAGEGKLPEHPEEESLLPALFLNPLRARKIIK